MLGPAGAGLPSEKPRGRAQGLGHGQERARQRAPRTAFSEGVVPGRTLNGGGVSQEWGEWEVFPRLGVAAQAEG